MLCRLVHFLALLSVPLEKKNKMIMKASKEMQTLAPSPVGSVATSIATLRLPSNIL